MKFYVDEMPKECWDCKFTYQEHSFDRQRCLFNGKHISDNKKDCPLHSLPDHDQQVRADERKKTTIEICERLNAIIEKYLCKKGRHRESIDISSIIRQMEKGESNED